MRFHQLADALLVFADRDPTENFWLLRPPYYRSNRGIDLANGYSYQENQSSTMVF
ncbi:MAG: hypothetical protein R3E01_33745 [Pirellulaceae bacterium]|nr:hypothetical protein [Planctomycetales bacterium]